MSQRAAGNSQNPNMTILDTCIHVQDVTTIPTLFPSRHCATGPILNGQSYVLWRTPLPTCPGDIHRSLDQVGLRTACWRDVSIELGGKGSFQAVKLQRPARTTVCSHSTRDMAAMRSIESK